MANIQERRDKTGKLISFSVRVFRGRDLDGNQLKPYTTTFEVSPTWSEKTARKKAEAFAATFEKECLEGITSDTRMTFADYCEYVISLKEATGTKHSTILWYRDHTKLIYPEIGHIKLKDLRVDHLNALYTKLLKRESSRITGKASAKTDLSAILKAQGKTCAGIARDHAISVSTVAAAVRGETVARSSAEIIAEALGMKTEQLFKTPGEKRNLRPVTVAGYHRVISMVLSQAEREGLVPFNAAARATLPKQERKEVNYFQPEEIAAIRDALEEEPILWKTLTHMLLITGARRGEILGLKWDAVDLDRGQIHICNNVLYSKDRGIYEDTPKTKKSNRFVSLPAETVQLLRWYAKWQEGEKERMEGYYQDRGFLFAQDNGDPVRPDTVTYWLDKFSKRHGLPHINPHAFRHTMASLLYFNGVDAVSISSRLGHAQVSTTADIYAHVMQEADRRNADILSRIMLKAKAN